VHGGIYVFGLMWSPGVAAILTRLIHQRNLRGEGWGWGGTRWQLLAYFLPLAYATLAYGMVWLVGLGGLGRFRTSLPLFIVAGTAQSCLSALGEELGWRGLLVPELAKLTDFTGTALISGGCGTGSPLPQPRRLGRHDRQPTSRQGTTIRVNGGTYACRVTRRPTRQASAIEWKNT